MGSLSGTTTQSMIVFMHALEKSVAASPKNAQHGSTSIAYNLMKPKNLIY